MNIPTFIGIGVPKAGTTWLHNLLAEHPQVYVSQRVKEIDYFNLRYDRGETWYRSFFPDYRDALAYHALGEISTAYIYCDKCPERIHTLVPEAKLILMLRNPIDRVWSHYLQRIRLGNYQHSFEDFLVDYPKAAKLGLYTQPIRNYLRYFDSEKLLVLIFEQIFADIPGAKVQLSEFLEIDPTLFPKTAGYAKVNQSFVPHFGKAFALAAKARIWASGQDYYWAINLAKALGMKKVLSIGAKKESRSMRPETRDRLQTLYSQDILDLEILLGVELGHWYA